ncbi:hypothetical protein K458DRAFT_336512 [Lentithecium fluviatile CBS 122367]|uniref:Anaphase-promoting complex subunit 2 n=1 Tax=Lentithecium fluviatile CBS 122367 TaxID=1168545 RepID=A0A6G1J5H2_9PLEO|nr:hypothetical protein K458DRAFT_336512 [Lentithecium fluviatile CBS 122367]
MDHATHVFASVFPVPSLSHTTPTPVATPDLGYTAPDVSFGSPFTQNAGGAQQRAAKRLVAWSTATRFLSLHESHGRSLRRSREVDGALHYLLVGEGKSQDGEAREEEGLVEWYTNEARIHFAGSVRPGLRELWEKEIKLRDAWDLLEKMQRMLEQIQALYIQPFNDHILPFLHEDASSITIRASRDVQAVEAELVEGAKAKFARDIHAAFAHSLPRKRFSKTLSYILYDAGCRLFRFYNRHDGVETPSTPEPTRAVRERMTNLLSSLERVGLGGDNAQKAFAHAMNKLLDTFISSHYLKVDWYSKKPVVPDLKSWIENGFVPLVELVMECLRCNDGEVQPMQLKAWQEMGLVRLGRARVEELFNFVIYWDRSLGAILDLKEYLKLNGAKEHLRASFSRQVSSRLLHPGATTTYILNVYISIIRAFHRLEPKGVLLQSVARPIRRYLKEREDTARIIISSLLIDVDDENSGKFTSSGDLSYEIASEMSKPFAHSEAADDEFNWNDMDWQPLPHDASPEYKKSKVEDVIYFLLTLWDREDFINELKNILGDHLLRCQDLEYQKEIRLLELIKIRLGEDKLQACEVMLRDVLESRRINDTIRTAAMASTPHNQNPHTPEGRGARTPQPHRPTTSAPSHHILSTPRHKPTSNEPTLNAQILSSFFWPILRDDEFRVPAQIESLQKAYESRFERIKGMRKLRWMNALGDSTITLEFEDRKEEFAGLTMWQVSVVYAFQPQPSEEWVGKGKGKSQGVTRNVEQLEEMLDMDEGLVRQALAFWVGKSVLRLTSPDTYTVIERLSSATTADDNAAAAASELAEVQAAQTTTVKSQADLLNERKDVYMSFVIGMLTNQGNLGVQRILMMMRMMVQGGFPFGPEEVRGLLGEMESTEKVVSLGGDVWGIKKM